MTPISPHVRILALEAENFKKLKAVAIRPAGALVQVTGKNRNGKTSVLDAVWAALGGGRTLPVEPIRHGEEKARIRLEIGDARPEIIVTRTFTAKEEGGYTTGLKVESGEGAKFASPQEVLDALVGSLSFDPLAFTRLKDEERLELLRPLAPSVDFETLTAENAADFEARTVANRKARETKAQAEGVTVPPGAVPARVDAAALEEELASSAQYNGDIQERRSRRNEAKRAIEALVEEEELLRQKLDALIARREGLESKLAEAEELPAEKDILAIRGRLADARAINAHADAAERRAGLVAEAGEHEAEAARLTKAMDERDKAMAAAVAAAVGNVEGLAFEGGRITLGGAPFDQASDAEQLEASILIAGLLNPKLRVIRVRDGSLLDEDALAALETMAERLDLQCWVERVDGSGAVGFVLENGEIKGPGTAPAVRRTPDRVEFNMAAMGASLATANEDDEEAV